MSKVWYSLSVADTFWFSMGLEGGLGMGLLVQLSNSKVWYSLGGAHTFWLSMGLEGDFGMGLLVFCE